MFYGFYHSKLPLNQNRFRILQLDFEALVFFRETSENPGGARTSRSFWMERTIQKKEQNYTKVGWSTTTSQALYVVVSPRFLWHLCYPDPEIRQFDTRNPVVEPPTSNLKLIKQSIETDASIYYTSWFLVETSFFKVTWIDSPNGGHGQALKGSLVGLSEVTLKNLGHVCTTWLTKGFTRH